MDWRFEYKTWNQASRLWAPWHWSWQFFFWLWHQKQTNKIKYTWVSYIKLKSFCTAKVRWDEVAQSCPTLCDPVDCCLSGYSVHGIFQARVLEWVAISFSRETEKICTAKETIKNKKEKDNLLNKIFANYIADMALIFKI